jgi:hypothetical protein
MGAVAVCNAIGTGVADDKAVFAHVPGLSGGSKDTRVLSGGQVLGRPQRPVVPDLRARQPRQHHRLPQPCARERPQRPRPAPHLAALIAYETVRFAKLRERLRHQGHEAHQPPAPGRRRRAQAATAARP